MDLYRARWLLPIDREPIERGELLVHNGCIVEVGRDLYATTATIHDLGEAILLPGFINAHTHLELSAYRGKLSPGPLWSWLEELVALRRRPAAAELERQAILDGAAESLAAGVTCVGDISRNGSNLSVLRSSPIRKVCFMELFSGAKQQPNDFASLERLVGDYQALVEPGRNIMGISPHAPYSVGWNDLVESIGLAARRNLPLTMHFLETIDERQWLSGATGPLTEFLSRYGLPNAQTGKPKTARDILVRSGLLSRGPLFAHVNYADDEIISLLAGSRATVVWCPRTHAFFGHHPHRWREMLSAGINVCLGTDSLAGAPSLSILEELRFLRRQAPDVAPRQLLDMATSRAAAGIHLLERIGTLSPDKCADFLSIAWDPAAPAEPAQNILEGRGKILSVWVEGRRVVHNPS